MAEPLNFGEGGLETVLEVCVSAMASTEVESAKKTVTSTEVDIPIALRIAFYLVQLLVGLRRLRHRSKGEASRAMVGPRRGREHCRRGFFVGTKVQLLEQC